MTVTAIPKTASAQTSTGAAETPAKGSRKKLIMIIVAVLVLGGGGYYQFLMPKASGPPKPGLVVKLDPIQINLAGEHYLRIGIALQLVDGVKEEDGSKALDATIDLFSGLPMAEVNDATHRKALKKQLVKQLVKSYDREVMGLYFTELVTQ